MKTTIKLTLLISILLFCNTSKVYSQLKVISDGSVSIHSTAGDWGSAMNTNVFSPYTCAYHLRYNGRDKFYVCANGWVWAEQGFFTGSDINLKKNVTSIQSALATIMKLRGVSYQYKQDHIPEKDREKNPYRLGLIAQEVEKVIPDIVKTAADKTKSIAYMDLIGLLIEGVKEIQLEIETTNEKLILQEQEIKTLTDRLNKIEKTVDVSENILNSKSTLHQNRPNPFKETTLIEYEIDEVNFTSASIMIFDMNGVLLKKYSLPQSGKNSLSINGRELKAGMYIYTLVVNNQEIDTKRMILLK